MSTPDPTGYPFPVPPQPVNCEAPVEPTEPVDPVEDDETE